MTGLLTRKYSKCIPPPTLQIWLFNKRNTFIERKSCFLVVCSCKIWLKWNICVVIKGLFSGSNVAKFFTNRVGSKGLGPCHLVNKKVWRIKNTRGYEMCCKMKNKYLVFCTIWRLIIHLSKLCCTGHVNSFVQKTSSCWVLFLWLKHVVTKPLLRKERQSQTDLQDGYSSSEISTWHAFLHPLFCICDEFAFLSLGEQSLMSWSSDGVVNSGAWSCFG